MAQALQILTANRLREGDVVYWQNASWVARLDEADVFETKDAAQAALTAAQADIAARLVVNPYLFDVRRDAHGLHPVKERELIRAKGPSVRTDLGKQARHVSL
jgi:hypothetical protein